MLTIDVNNLEQKSRLLGLIRKFIEDFFENFFDSFVHYFVNFGSKYFRNLQRHDRLARS